MDVVGVVAAVGFPQLWISRLGRGVLLILLAPLCNTQTQRGSPALPDQPPPAEKFTLRIHRPDTDALQVFVNN